MTASPTFPFSTPSPSGFSSLPPILETTPDSTAPDQCLASAVIHSSAEERAHNANYRILSALSVRSERESDGDVEAVGLRTFSNYFSGRVAQDRMDRIRLVALIRLGLNQRTSIEDYLTEIISRGLITPGDLLAELSTEPKVVHR